MLTSAVQVFAQTPSGTFQLSKIVQPSPNASALGRYGEIPVSISTGVPQISVPLFEVASSQIKVPVSISYHASGIKVTDRASVVGLGWALNAGGVITRMKRGEWDEEPNGFYNMVFPDETDPAIADKEFQLAAGITSPIYRNLYPYDGQPDIFYYNINGKSGKFLFKNRVAANLPPEIVTVPYSNVKIRILDVDVAGPTIINWGRIEIIDEDGTTYIFGVSLNEEDAREQTHTESGGNVTSDDFDHTTAWYLTNIISADKSDIVYFKYGAPYTTSFGSGGRVLVENHSNPDDWTQVTSYEYPSSSSVSSFTNSLNLTEIQFNSGKLVFAYDFLNGFPSVQKLSAVKLMKDNNGVFSEIRRFDLNHSSFYNAIANNCLRLDGVVESGTSSSGTITKPATLFDYYPNFLGQKAAPLYNTKSQDLWGYYNGETNDDLLLVSAALHGPLVNKAVKRKPNESYLKVGTLNKITYSTGGSTQFNFEANQTTRTYTQYTTTYNYLSFHISNLLGTNTENFTVADDMIVVNDPTPSIPLYNTKVVFTADATSCTTCPGEARFILEDLTTSSIILDQSISDPETQYIDPVTGLSTRKFYLTLVTGHNYRVYFPNPGTSGNYRYVLNVSSENAKYVNPTVTSSEVTEPVLTGGLRVKEIISDDGTGNTLTKQYKYTKSYYNSDLFQGDFEALAQGSFNSVKMWWDDLGSPSDGVSRIISITYLESGSLPLGSSSTSLAYEKVEEYQKDNQGNDLGKTEYTFSVVKDDIPAFLPFYRNDRSSERDRLMSKKIYKRNGSVYSVIQEDQNTYTNFAVNPGMWIPGSDKIKFYLSTSFFDIDDAHSIPSVYQGAYCLGCQIDVLGDSKFRIEPFYISIDKTLLTSTISRVVGDDGSILSSTTNYFYDNPKHLQPTSVTSTNSLNEETKKTMLYPMDFTGTVCPTSYPCEVDFNAQLLVLKTNLYACQTPSREKWHYYYSFKPYPNGTFLQYPDSTLKYDGRYKQCQTNYETAVAALVTQKNSCLVNLQSCIQAYYNSMPDDTKALFDLTNKNIVSPVVEQKEYNESKLLSTTITRYKSLSGDRTLPLKIQFATLNNSLEDRIEFVDYNSSSKILTQKKSNDIQVGYVWDYKDQLPTAEVTNAANSDIAFTSFETTTSGGWTMTSTQRDASLSFTGVQCYSMTNGNITRTVDPGKIYIVSFWVKSLASILVTVNGITPTVRMYKNGWSYCEVEITASTITISGSDKIDDLRLYPKGAMMKTYTYEPLVGVTSETDANSQVIYYEYDSLGRLITVRNADNKIVKTFTYNYKK
jgi:YD repeat-containing protein